MWSTTMSIECKNVLQRKILLVDDDNDFRWATGNILESAGYKVVHAKDGDDALNFLEKDVGIIFIKGSALKI